MPYRHIPVMRAEVLEFLDCRPGKTYVDGTVGGAGHARAILERTAPDGVLIGLDQDADAIAHAKTALEPFAGRVRLVHANFAQLPEVLSELNIPGADGLLLDLGVSLHHFEGSGRGFSFQQDEPLDMRMDVRTEQTAADIVAGSSEDELRALLSRVRRGALRRTHRPASGRRPAHSADPDQRDPWRASSPGRCPAGPAAAFTRPPASSWRCGSRSTASWSGWKRSWAACRSSSSPADASAS